MSQLNDKLNTWVGTDGIDYTDPDLGIAHCFKHLVPKIIKSADYSVIITQDLAKCTGYVRPMQGGRQYDAIDNQNPALALCLADEVKE